ncbi:MAG: hypothetical protein IJT36_03250 [Alphaproteobacteria bacterium]|nr:hypothetical protein [Alphaproteobacteria bacterium]
MKKFIVYVDENRYDGEVKKLGIPAKDEETARKRVESECAGEIILVKDITDEHEIIAGVLTDTLHNSGYSSIDISLIMRTLKGMGIVND